MPPRYVSVAILVFWAFAAVGLATRDILPEWIVGLPPDFQSISRAADSQGPSRWLVQVVDKPGDDDLRSVGQASTESIRRGDGGLELRSRIWFDSSELLRGTSIEAAVGVRLSAESSFQVDPSGNLKSFLLIVRASNDPEPVMTVEGRQSGGKIEVVSRGALPLLTWKRTLEYAPRGLVQDGLGPIDRLPGLHLGQRWETRVVSPITGRVETARVEVARKRVIHWGTSPVTTFEVLQKLGPLTSRAWVRPDGLVLRQEIPFPLVKLVLERQAAPVDVSPNDPANSPQGVRP
ncbi:MAG: hypothetical protein KGM43_12060 [Planctomycetota bacterium]|nr:hypothetical protein [Planctomycetota bacterium]